MGFQQIKMIKDLGVIVQTLRKQKKLTQKEAAAFCGVGTRFLSELENGKPSLETEKVLHVIQAFGLNVYLKARGDKTA